MDQHAFPLATFPSGTRRSRMTMLPWATPMTEMSSWVFARMEQAGHLSVGASVYDALTAARHRSALISTFSEPEEMPLQALRRLHHSSILPRLPSINISTDMVQPWSRAAAASPEEARISQYMKGFHEVLRQGAM